MRVGRSGVALRGACDGLNFAPPVEGPDRALYEAARPNLRVPVSGPKAALPLDGRLGLHPAAKSLHDLYKAGRLALVHAACPWAISRPAPCWVVPRSR